MRLEEYFGRLVFENDIMSYMAYLYTKRHKSIYRGEFKMNNKYFL